MAIANPAIIGPIAATTSPGDPAHGYPFMATNLLPAGSGYIEQEFFVEGSAARYSTSCDVVVCPVDSSNAPATVVSSGHPYRVRMIVRRPGDASKFNGHVIVEWLNVWEQYELDFQWHRSSQYFVRNGFAYVGVGPQRVGIHAAGTGLRAWSPARYGSLDVTAGGAINDDSLKWDIFSQAGQSLARPAGVDPLGGLQPRVLIATGDSQSSANLATYLNTIHRLDPVYSGAVLAGPLGIPIRSDVATRVLKVPGEWDVISYEAGIRRADSENLVSWEIAGMAHSPYQIFVANAEIQYRDIGRTGILPGTTQCIDPARSRVHSNFVMNAAFAAMAKWLASGARPPPMPEPLRIGPTSPTGDRLARDSSGLAIGGIRLPDVSVPVATNSGWNSGAKSPTPDIECQHAGTSVAFDAARLAGLYSSHEDYVAKVAAAAAVNVGQGFLLAEDAATLVAEADASDVLAVPRADASVRVAEFFEPVSRRFFWSSDPGERSFMDFEGGGGGWFRTGETFFAWPPSSAAPAGAAPVCRMVGAPGIGPMSHFYSADPAQCAALANSGVWVNEGIAFAARAECGDGLAPVTRLWRAGATNLQSRHRFAVRDSAIAQSRADGFVVEGTVLCVPR